MKLYVLSGVTGNDSSTVLGVYTTPNDMRVGLAQWHAKGTELSHYFYDVKEVNSQAEWTNEQSAIYL